MIRWQSTGVVSICNSASCEEKQQQQKPHAFSWSMNCMTMTTKHLLCWPNCLIYLCQKIHCKQLVLQVYGQMPCIVFCYRTMVTEYQTDFPALTLKYLPRVLQTNVANWAKPQTYVATFDTCWSSFAHELLSDLKQKIQQASKDPVPLWGKKTEPKVYRTLTFHCRQMLEQRGYPVALHHSWGWWQHSQC